MERNYKEELDQFHEKIAELLISKDLTEEKQKILKEKISTSDSVLKEKMKVDDTLLAEHKIKNEGKANEDARKYASMEEDLKSSYVSNKKKHDDMIKVKQNTLNTLEAKIKELTEMRESELNKMRESAKKLAEVE